MSLLKFSRTSLTDHGWYTGDLSWMLRPNGQSEIANFVRTLGKSPDEARPVIVNAHRRLGKSFLMVNLGQQDCLSRPGMFVKYVAGTYEQVRDIVVPLFDQILLTCPEEILPQRRGYEWKWRLPHWPKREYSTFKLVAANYRQGNMARGQACDRAYLDEVRDFEHLSYFVESVLGPQFVDRPDPLMVMCSTPPQSMDHDFTRPGTGFIYNGMVNGRYICVPGSKNADFTDRDRKILRDLIPGGEASVAWRREVECELISDQESLITPEFWVRKAQLVVEKYDRPAEFVPYTVMDTGYDPDFTAILCGYIDFTEQLYIFELEHFERRMTLSHIANTVKRMEKLLGYDNQGFQVVRRHADIDERGLADLRIDHRIFFQPVKKFNEEAALARFRSRLDECRFRIVRAGCPQFIYQLEHGIYNRTRTDFERSDTVGHWDLGKAGVYSNRVVNWGYNPIRPAERDPLTTFGARSTTGTIGLGNAISRILGQRRK